MNKKMAIGLVLALTACAPASEENNSGVSAAATAETTVYGSIAVVEVGNRRPALAANEPIELRVSSVVLNAQGQPVAYAGGVPFSSCANAEATSRATTDESGRYEVSIAAPGTYCIWARGHEIDFSIDGTMPTKGLDDLVIDLNTYGSTCVLPAIDATTSKPTRCLARRGIVGESCYCQVSMTAYDEGKLVADD